MNKIVLLILVLALVVPLLAGNIGQPNQGNSGGYGNNTDDHIHEFKARGKGNVNPNVRKCLNVQCRAGQACFHGRCIQTDTKCASLNCADGFRCVNGACVARKCQAQKVICSPVGFSTQKERCDSDLLKKCKTAKIVQASCGFNSKTKAYNDYASPCDACTDKKCSVDFFYPVACTSAPRICAENEECMNGICTTALNDPTFKDYETCNSSSDCQINESCAGHRCVDKRDLYNYLDSMSDTTNIQMRMC